MGNLKFSDDGRLIVPKFKKPETKREKQRRLRRAFQNKRNKLVKKYKGAINHRKEWDSNDLRNVLLNFKDKKDLFEVNYYCEKYGREVGSMEWIFDIRERLIKGVEMTANPLEKDSFARQIKRILEEESII